MTAADLLRVIIDEARIADDKAREACKKSHYSVQDYWLCVEFKMQQLHDRCAREMGVSDRCPIFPFRQEVNSFRRRIISADTPLLTRAEGKRWGRRAGK